jgi:hypothetical protein
MKNHQSRPTGFSPFPETNTTSFSEVNATSFKGNHGRGRGRGPRRGRGRGRDPEEVVDVVAIMFGDMKV